MEGCNLDVNKGKEIADGLMRAKQLEILKIGNNPSLGQGGQAILYNLAFSPKINHIDFTNNLMGTNESAEAIYKLIKISGSLENLILDNTNINNFLSKEFFVALGENKTLHFLSIQVNSGTMAVAKLNDFGIAIGMNHKKNGSLKYVNMAGCISNAVAWSNFCSCMKISDYDHEMMYGDKKIAKDMSK